MLPSLLHFPLASEPGFAPGSSEPLLYVLGGLSLLVAMLALSNQRGKLYSASLVYLTMGVGVAVTVEVLDVRWLDPVRDASTIAHASELAVIVALFATGLSIERRLGWAGWASAWRLLGVVMPLTIVAVAGWGVAVMGLSIGAAIVLAAALAPTDPVLAGDLGVGPPGEPDDSEPRFALTSEAGFNDGLAFPFVMLGLLLAGPTASERWVPSWVLGDVVWGLSVAFAIGAALGSALGAVYRRWRSAGHVRVTFDAWIALAAVLAIYGVTELVDGYGFVAAFVAGLAFNRAEDDEDADRRVHRGGLLAEKVGELALVLLVGSLLSTRGVQLPGAGGWALVVLLLVVIRPVATLLAFAGSPLALRERLFIGWFGVRGIGSVYYAAFASSAAVLPANEARVILWTVLVAATASIVAHGLTAEPLQRLLAEPPTEGDRDAARRERTKRTEVAEERGARDQP
ncbi:MAG: cation:proton antiporter [Solirubrobacteraceae bacterium]|nr:cation:proton antiporter [Solirubrobacteraceae bacterium]